MRERFWCALIAGVLALSLAAPVAFADDHVVIQAYDVTDLVRKIRHFPAPKLGLEGVEEATSPFGEDDEEDETLSVEDLVELIKENVAPGTWDDGPNRITFHGTTIVVACRAGAHGTVATALAGIRGAPPVLFDVATRMVTATPDALARLGFERGGAAKAKLMEAAPARGVLAELEQDGLVTAVCDPKLVVVEKQLASVALTRPQVYVEDVRIDPATGGRDIDVAILQDGFTLEVSARRYRFGEGALLRWKATVARAEIPKRSDPGGIDLPVVASSTSEGRKVIRPDHLLVVRGLQSPEIGPGREGVLILSCSRRK